VPAAGWLAQSLRRGLVGRAGRTRLEPAARGAGGRGGEARNGRVGALSRPRGMRARMGCVVSSVQSRCTRTFCVISSSASRTLSRSGLPWKAGDSVSRWVSQSTMPARTQYLKCAGGREPELVPIACRVAGRDQPVEARLEDLGRHTPMVGNIAEACLTGSLPRRSLPRRCTSCRTIWRFGVDPLSRRCHERLGVGCRSPQVSAHVTLSEQRPTLTDRPFQSLRGLWVVPLPNRTLAGAVRPRLTYEDPDRAATAEAAV
jgi:hypothetical protein